MTQSAQSEVKQPLVPASMRPNYDPSTDKLLMALREEVQDLISKPFDGRSLGTAQILLQHASEILQLRKGAQRQQRRRKGLSYINVSNGGGSYSMGDGETEGEEDDDGTGGVLASAPGTETFATNAKRGIMGATTELLGIAKQFVDGRERGTAHERMLAAESVVRAMATASASSMPDDIRREVVEKLRGQFDDLMANATFDAPPDLVAHDHNHHRDRKPDEPSLVVAEAAQ